MHLNYDNRRKNSQLLIRTFEYISITLLAALSVNKPSDALRTVYFDKALEIIQMEEYQETDFTNEDATDSNSKGKKIEV